MNVAIRVHSGIEISQDDESMTIIYQFSNIQDSKGHTVSDNIRQYEAVSFQCISALLFLVSSDESYRHFGKSFLPRQRLQ